MAAPAAAPRAPCCHMMLRLHPATQTWKGATKNTHPEQAGARVHSNRRVHEPNIRTINKCQDCNVPLTRTNELTNSHDVVVKQRGWEQEPCGEKYFYGSYTNAADTGTTSHMLASREAWMLSETVRILSCQVLHVPVCSSSESTTSKQTCPLMLFGIRNARCPVSTQWSDRVELNEWHISCFPTRTEKLSNKSVESGHQAGKLSNAIGEVTVVFVLVFVGRNAVGKCLCRLRV